MQELKVESDRGINDHGNEQRTSPISPLPRETFDMQI